MTHFRRHSALTVAFLIAAIGALPIASAIAGWLGGIPAPELVEAALAGLAFILIVGTPLVLAAWTWRSGTDADDTAVYVRALAGTRTIPWSAISTLSADSRGGVWATLADGSAVHLTAVAADQMPILVAASGRALERGDGDARPSDGARDDGRQDAQ